MSTLKDRAIEARMSVEPDNVSAFARRLGISPQAVYAIEAGTTLSFKGKTQAAYERETGYSGAWIETGKGQKMAAAGAHQPLVRKHLRRSDYEDLEQLSCTVNDTTAIILTVCRFLADSIPSAALALSERVRAETLVESGPLSELVAMVLERGHEAVAPFDTFPQGKKTLSHP